MMRPHRRLSLLLLLPVLVYTFTAYGIKAPIQYDPLGPGGWPKLLAWLFIVVLVLLFVFDKNAPSRWSRKDWKELVPAAKGFGLLLLYAILFQPLGFILSTCVTTVLFAKLHSARWLISFILALILGVGGYLLCATLLGLNLPRGEIFSLFGGA